jgi:hypothetical protein
MGRTSSTGKRCAAARGGKAVLALFDSVDKLLDEDAERLSKIPKIVDTKVCCCSNSIRCKKAAEDLLLLSPELCRFISFPSRSNEDTRQRLASRFCHYLGNSIDDWQNEDRRMFIRLFHFPPIDRLRMLRSSVHYLPKKMPRAHGDFLGLSDLDATDPLDDNSDYFTLPSHGIVAIELEVSNLARLQHLENRDKIRRSSRSLAQPTETLESQLSDKTMQYEDCRDKLRMLEIDVTYSEKMAASASSANFKAIGLSRDTIGNREWHRKNPLFCKENLCGPLGSFEELLVLIAVHFPGVDLRDDFIRNRSDKQICTFEKIVMFLLRVQGGQSVALIKGIFAITRRHVNRCIRQVAPYMGDAGRNMITLDITDDIARGDIPKIYQEFTAKTGISVRALIDGKAYPIESTKKSAFIQRLCYSVKLDQAGVQSMVWTSPPGLIEEYTPPCLALATEVSHVQAWGSIRETTPLRNERRYESNVLAPLDEAMSFAETVVFIADENEDVEDDDESGSGSGKEDEADRRSVAQELIRGDASKRLIIGKKQAGGRTAYDKRIGSGSDGEGDSADEKDPIEARENESVGNMLLRLWDQDVDEIAESINNANSNRLNTRRRRGKMSRRSVNSSVQQSLKLDNLDNAMEYVTLQGPNLNATTKIRQLESQNRFRTAVKEKKIKLEDVDDKLMRGLTEDTEDGEVQYTLPTRLSKYPAGEAICGDRGFKQCAVFYEHFYFHLCPTSLGGRTQFEFEDIVTDQGVKELRFTSEVPFSRTKNCKIFSSTIGREDLSLLDDALCWAYAMVNLYKPMREPGDWEEHVSKYR